MVNVFECLMPYCRAEVYARGDCCEDCWADRVGQLESLPELYVMTYAMLTPGSRQQEINTIHMAAIDPAAPINLVALDTLTYSYSRLAGWAAYVYPCRLNLTGYTSGKAFVTAVGILQSNDHKLALTQFAGGYVLDVFVAYRRLVVQCVPNGPRHLDAACPDCAAATLVTRHADEYVMCLTCGSTWPHSFGQLIQRTRR